MTKQMLGKLKGPYYAHMIAATALRLLRNNHHQHSAATMNLVSAASAAASVHELGKLFSRKSYRTQQKNSITEKNCVNFRAHRGKRDKKILETR